MCIHFVLPETSTSTVVRGGRERLRLECGACYFEYRLFTFYVEPEYNHM